MKLYSILIRFGLPMLGLVGLGLPGASVARAAAVPSTPVETRVEVLPTDAGADLITFFRNDVPVLSVLRDTLGDAQSGAHRFREVWALSYARPNMKQRLLASLPFFYHRAAMNHGSKRGVPEPIFDDSQPSKGIANRLGQAIVQADVINGLGFAWRGPTRAYRRNASEYRNMYLARALDVVEESTTPENLPADLASEDWDELRGRLALAAHLMGGYVSEERVAGVAAHDRTEAVEDRAANFDLLRQAAEKNGLYIESLQSPEGLPQQAIVWFTAAGVPTAERTRFNAELLGIADPWNDARLKAWTGYTETWFLDPEGAVVDRGDSTGSPAKMIPLALYALDYPRVPLLLIDFRSDRARRRELMRRAADDVATSVFDLTPYSSLSWWVTRTTYLWVQDHRGGALNRTDREAAYGRLREALLEGLDRDESGRNQMLQKKLDSLALNPFEQNSANEAALARRQYAALTRWATDPDGLAKELRWARAREEYESTHTSGRRALDRILQLASFGKWRPYKPSSDEPAAEARAANLDRRRRNETAVRAAKGAKSLPPEQPATSPGDDRETAAVVLRMAQGKTAAGSDAGQ